MPSGRSNAEHFICAAETIFDHLVVASPSRQLAAAWHPLSSRLEQALIREMPSRNSACAAWGEVFDEVRFEYSAKEWQTRALQAPRTDSGSREPGERGVVRFEFIGGMEYLWFHAVAGEQREFVLSRIRTDLQ